MRKVAKANRLMGTDRVRVHIGGVYHDVAREDIEALAGDLVKVLASFARDDNQRKESSQS